MPVDPPREHTKPERVHAPSLVLLNTGHGKGKSTAAFGTAMRALARGWRVGVVQFIKSGTWRTGESKVLADLGADFFEVGDGFTWLSEDMSETQAIALAGWEAAKERIASGDYDVLVLDEITYVVNWGWLDVEEVVETIESRPEHVHLILTGRDADPRLVEVADTVTRMEKVKHAYDRGVHARRGIDF